MAEFVDFPKIARLNREMVITEKIDGSNAQVCIFEEETLSVPKASDFIIAQCFDPYSGALLTMYAGSRNRWLKPLKAEDNHGFARWCEAHAQELWGLGPGRHFGEWYGGGIQRTYGLKEKRFALFNVHRWGPDRDKDKHPQEPPTCCGVVPVLYTGLFDTEWVKATLVALKLYGSRAVPGYMNPEGVVVFHTAAGVPFKVTTDNDGQPKGMVHAEN